MKALRWLGSAAAAVVEMLFFWLPEEGPGLHFTLHRPDKQLDTFRGVGAFSYKNLPRAKYLAVVSAEGAHEVWLLETKEAAPELVRLIQETTALSGSLLIVPLTLSSVERIPEPKEMDL